MNRKSTFIIFVFIAICFLTSTIKAQEKVDYRKLGDEYVKEYDYKQAILYYEKAIEETPNDADSYFKLGKTYNELDGKILKAKRAFEEAIRLNPRYGDAYDELVGIYCKVELHDFEKYPIKTVEMINKSLEIDPDNYGYLLGASQIAYRYDRFDEAIKVYSKRIKLKPDDPENYFYISACFAQTGKIKEALESFKKAVELDPSYKTTALHINDFAPLCDNEEFLDLVGVKLGLSDQILKLKEELKSKPDDVLKYLELARLYDFKEDKKNALLTYIQAIALSPNLILETGRILHNLCVEKEDFDKLSDFLEKYSNNETASAPLYEIIGFIYMDKYNKYKDKKDIDKSIQYYKKSIKIDPKHNATMQYLGIAHRLKGDYEQAIATLNKDIGLNVHRDPSTFFELAQTYSLSGNKQKAIEYLKKAIDGDSEYCILVEFEKDLDNIRNTSEFKELMDSYYK